MAQELYSLGTGTTMGEGLRAEIVRKRSDLSFFLVHLTKNDEKMPAIDHLRGILTPESDGHCRLKATLHGFFTMVNSISNNPSRAKWLRAVCFTEAPLDEVKHFAYQTEDGERKYSPFGVVFPQEFIRRCGGNPCFYVNTLGTENLKSGILTLAEDPHIDESGYRHLLVFFNIFGPAAGGRTHDFYWEREWRVPGDMRFRHEDVFVGLCPEGHLAVLDREFPRVLFIDPAWSHDEILEAVRGMATKT